MLESVAVVSAMYVIRVYLQGQTTTAGVPAILFVVTGFMPNYGFRTTVGAVMSAIERKASARMFPQITSLDVVLAAGISAAIIAAGAMMATMAIAAVMTGQLPVDPLDTLLAGWLILTLAVSFGLVIGPVLRFAPGLNLVMGALLRINFILSGAVFLGTEVPPAMLPYVSWNPGFHCVELMREGWFRGYVSPIADPAFVILCIVALFAVGLSFERVTSRSQIS